MRSVIQLGDDFDVIFHLAAIIGVSHVLSNPYKVLQENCQLLTNLIELGKRQSKLARVLFSSTSEVYAGTLKEYGLKIPTEESTPLTLTSIEQPRTSYMLSKIYGEALCQHSGLPFTIFRPHNVYGPRMGMSHVVPEQLKKAHFAEEGDKIEVFSLQHSRCFCFIEDAVYMLHRMMGEKRCEGKTLNLGTEKPEVTIKQVVEACFKTVGKTLIIDEKEGTEGSPVRRAPEMTLTKELTGYESIIELEEGLARTYEWYRTNIFEGTSVSAK